MRIVLDTNVLVCGLLSPFGPPGEIVRMVSSGTVELCFDARILAEYGDVLAREHIGFERDAVAALLEYVEFRGEVVAPDPLTGRLPDTDDEPFLEAALASGAECLVTGSVAHFPPDRCGEALVLTPAQFIERCRLTGGEPGGGHAP